MSISTNLGERITDAEVNRFGEIETALLKTDMADQIDSLRSLKADFKNVHTLSVTLPSRLQELRDLADQLGCHRDLMEYLPVLRKVGATDEFVLLGRMLFHYYLKLGNRIRRIFHRENNVYETIPSLVAQIRSKKTPPGLDLRRLIDLEIAMKAIAEEVAEDIAVFSLPKPSQLISVSPDSRIFRFGCSARATKIFSIYISDETLSFREWKIKGIYLLAENDFKTAAEHFLNIRRKTPDPYGERALTAWANLSWLLHSDEERARSRYARSISRIAENPHQDGIKEVEVIEEIKQMYFGEKIQTERDDLDWIEAGIF